MQAGDTIRLLTRYQAGSRMDPRENRLTAALAALLIEGQEIAVALTRRWLKDGGVEGSIGVKLQRPVGGNVGWVDLELEVKGPKPRLIWVEVKLGHRLSGTDQLSKYVVRLREINVGDHDRLVILLAPAQRRPQFRGVRPLEERTGEGDIGPFFVAWQDLYGILDREARRRSGRSHVRWLLREVMGYMESEDLKASELTPRHLAALGNIDEAFAALEAVLTRARVKLSVRWKPNDEFAKLRDTYWELQYRPGAVRHRRTRARLVWGVDGGDAFAGIYFFRPTGGAVQPRADDEWRVALQLDSSDPPWLEEDGDRDLIWVGRTERLRNLVDAKTVEEQGDELADFVRDTFSSIEAARPEGSP